MSLSTAAAQAAVNGGFARAAERAVPACFAVVDKGGNLLAFLADDRVMLACRELAIAKAYTSLSLRCSTASLTKAVQPGGPFYGLNTALVGKQFVTFAGGQVLGDPVVGAVGVSGGTLDDDEEISLAMVVACRAHRPAGGS